MKIKTILVSSIIVLLVFLIYLTTLDKKVYYVSLGDSLALGQTPYGNLDYGYTDYVKDYLIDKKILEKYIKEFSDKNYRITDLIRDINDNKKIYINNKPQTIKNALIKADLVTLSIGLNELLYKFGNMTFNIDDSYTYIDEVMEDMNELLSLVKEYCKEDIIVLGYYLPPLYSNDEEISKYIEYANKKLKDLCTYYGIYFIPLDSVIQSNSKYLPNPLDIHPSKLGYEVIATEIIKKIDKTLLK